MHLTELMKVWRAWHRRPKRNSTGRIGAALTHHGGLTRLRDFKNALSPGLHTAGFKGLFTCVCCVCHQRLQPC